MASYASYKKVHGDQMVDGTLTDNDINSNTITSNAILYHSQQTVVVKNNN